MLIFFKEPDFLCFINSFKHMVAPNFYTFAWSLSPDTVYIMMKPLFDKSTVFIDQFLHKYRMYWHKKTSGYITIERNFHYLSFANNEDLKDLEGMTHIQSVADKLVELALMLEEL